MQRGPGEIRGLLISAGLTDSQEAVTIRGIPGDEGSRVLPVREGKGRHRMGFHTGEMVKVERPSGRQYIAKIVAIDEGTYPYTVEIPDQPQDLGTWRLRVDQSEISPASDEDIEQSEIEQRAIEILEEQPDLSLPAAMVAARHERHGGAAGSFRPEGCLLCPDEDGKNAYGEEVPAQKVADPFESLFSSTEEIPVNRTILVLLNDHILGLHKSCRCAERLDKILGDDQI
jgi:hypothetical protein